MTGLRYSPLHVTEFCGEMQGKLKVGLARLINKLHHGKCFCTIFKHSFVFTKLTRKASRVRFVKTNSCVNIVR